jgi:hypothetical protein
MAGIYAELLKTSGGPDCFIAEFPLEERQAAL